MKKLLIGLALAAILVTGCTGTFSLTNELYQFHRDQERWADEALFLVFAITPVYGTALLADAVVLNSIEFWTGENPIQSTRAGAASADDNELIVEDRENGLTMRYDPGTQTVEVNSNRGAEKSFSLSRTDNGILMMDEKGGVLYSSTRDSLGGVTVRDMRNNTARYYSPAVVEKERSELFR
jgi:hypothetical protein